MRTPGAMAVGIVLVGLTVAGCEGETIPGTPGPASPPYSTPSSPQSPVPSRPLSSTPGLPLSPTPSLPLSSTAVGPPTSSSTSGTIAPPDLVPYRGDRFTVLLPGRPTAVTRRVPTAVGRLVVHLLVINVGLDAAYTFVYGDYPRGAPLNLDGAVRGAVANVGGRAVDVRRITYHGAPGRDFRIVGNAAGTAFQRVVLDGTRLYEMIVVVRAQHARTPPALFGQVLKSLRFRSRH